MVFGLFSKEKALQKTIERALNKLAQQPDRWGALEKLRDDGTEEALYGLCKRFSVTSQKGVEDEQEKNWVVDTLVEKGPVALAPLARFMKTSEHLSYALKVLEGVADHDNVLAAVDTLLADEPPGYVRHPDRRIDLLRWLAEWKAGTSDEIVARLTPYLVDFDENVRFAAIDGMSHHAAAKIADPLIDALLRPDEESGRIRRTIVEALAKTSSQLGARADQVAAMLTGPLSSFRVDNGVVKAR